MQLQMSENCPDIVFAWMMQTNSLGLMNLRQNHVNTVLKLFRGFFSMSPKVLSLQHQSVLVESFVAYLGSDVSKSMTPTLWLSVIDICNRGGEQHTKLKEIEKIARAQFDQGFNPDLLRTDMTKEDHEPATGRKVRK